jgi:adenine-specific DNA-methyltransferase
MTNQKLELTWLGKGEQPRLEPRLLLLEPEHCHGDPNADNILIHGDNLLALKALEQQYAGKVKCIYIDPPYNTGSAFEHYDDMVEHSIWLTLIKQRLEILRRLLTTDGSIWISIDDNECHYLKVLCDEVFGRQNFLTTVIWEKKYAAKSDSKHLSTSHDFILVFAKSIDELTTYRLPKTSKQNDRYTNKDNDIRGPWKPDNVLRNEFRDYAYFAVRLPSGKEVYPPPGTSWRYTKEKFAELIEDNRIWFGKDGSSRPAYKRFLSEVSDTIPSTTIWKYDEVGHNDEAKKESRVFNLDDVFATPKPERLIQRILTLATNPGDLVLDSFLGSGTTAAVAHKMGRRWIGIELGEHCYTHCVPRLRKVVSGEDQGGISKAVDWKGGGGFKTYRLAPSLLAADEHAMLRFNPDFTDDMVAEAVAKIEGFTYAPDPEVFWKQSRSSEKDYLLVTKIFVTAEWLAQLHEQMAEDESLLLCCPAFGDGCERAFTNISLKKIPNAFMRKYEFGKDDYSLNVQNVIGGTEEPDFLEAGAWEEGSAETPPRKKGKSNDDQQPTLF